MTVVLDPTVGGANANTYASVNETNAFAEATPYASNWEAAADGDLGEGLLVRSARVMQSLGYAGEQYSSSQAMAFPRCGVTDPSGAAYGTTVIPRCVKEAQMTLAVWLSAQSGDVFGQDSAANLSSLSAGPVTLEFRQAPLTSGQDYLQRVIIPMLVAGGVMGATNTVRLTR